jgi:uncharacterized protein (DUF885 family)
MKEKFDPEALSEDARLSYEIWELELARAEKSAEFRRHRYIFGRNGAHTGLVNFMINQHRVDEKSDMEAYISRVAAIGPTLDVLIERAKLAAADGIRMPGFAYDQTAVGSRARDDRRALCRRRGDSRCSPTARRRSQRWADGGQADAGRSHGADRAASRRNGRQDEAGLRPARCLGH